MGGTCSNKGAFSICGRQRGSLDINLDRGGQDLTAEEHVTLVDRQRLEVEFNGLLNIRDCLLERAP